MQDKFGNIVRCLYKHFLLKSISCESQINSLIHRPINSCLGIGLKLELLLSGVNLPESTRMERCFKWHDFKF